LTWVWIAFVNLFLTRMALKPCFALARVVGKFVCTYTLIFARFDSTFIYFFLAVDSFPAQRTFASVFRQTVRAVTA
jgi:hypothetical protein